MKCWVQALGVSTGERLLLFMARARHRSALVRVPPPHSCLLHLLSTMNQAPGWVEVEALPAMFLDRRKICLDIPTHRAAAPPLLHPRGPEARAMQSNRRLQRPLGLASNRSHPHTPACLAGGSEEPQRIPEEGRALTLAPGRGRQGLGDPTCPHMVDPGKA